MDVFFVNFVNPANRATAERHHKKLAYILPPWLYELSIECCDDQSKELLGECYVDSRYRRARVLLYPGYFVDTDAKQLNTLRHEYVHILMGGLAETLALLTLDDRSIEYHHESATEDIARLLASLETL